MVTISQLALGAQENCVIILYFGEEREGGARGGAVRGGTQREGVR